METERAILANGCFWGSQELLRKMPGVISTRTGYSGDPTTPNATYRKHGDHAESVEVIFDPSVLSFRRLLEFFFQIHEPTTLNRQGNDIGRSYRSAIFYTSDEQKQGALDTIADVERDAARHAEAGRERRLRHPIVAGGGCGAGHRLLS